MCVFSSSHTLIHLPIYFHNLLGRIGAQSAHGDLPIHMHINRYEHHTQIRTRIYIYMRQDDIHVHCVMLYWPAFPAQEFMAKEQEAWINAGNIHL